MNQFGLTPGLRIRVFFDGRIQSRGGGKQTQLLGQTASPFCDVNWHFPDLNKDFKTKFREKKTVWATVQ